MPDASMYPAPPQQQQGLLQGDPLKLIGALQAIQSLGLQRQQIPALAQQPAATLQGTNISNATAAFQQRALQNKWLDDNWGAQADKQGLGPEDVFNFQARAARAGVPADMIKDYADRLHKYKGGYAQSARDARAAAIGAEGTVVPETGPPGQGGAPTVIRRGAANQGPMQGFPVGLAPGVATRQEGAAATDNQLAAALSHEAEGSQARRGLLGNIMDLSDKFEPGPGAAQSKEVKSFINRNIPLPEGWKFDKGSVANQEEFAKQAAQFAQHQFGAIGGTGTDAKFNSAFTVSPSETMSKMGIKQVSRLLLGNEDAIQAKNKAWLEASSNDPNLSYRRFSADFNSHFDPRVFQFKYVPAKERQDYFDKMHPEDQARLLHDMTFARKQGWVKYDEAQERPSSPKPPPKPPIPNAELGKDADGKPAWFIRNGGGQGKHLQIKMPGLGG